MLCLNWKDYTWRTSSITTALNLFTTPLSACKILVAQPAPTKRELSRPVRLARAFGLCLVIVMTTHFVSALEEAVTAMKTQKVLSD